MRKYNGFQIKLFMLILMVLDHLPQIEGLFSFEVAGLFHMLSRCVGVWFGYLVVEGFQYTRDRLKYNLRLFGWSFLMGVGNIILGWAMQDKGVVVYNNIFLTLAFGVLILNILAYPIKKLEDLDSTLVKKIRFIIAILVTFVGVMITEGGLVILPFILITYLLRNKPKTRNIAYGFMSLVLFISFAQTFMMYRNEPEILWSMLSINSDFLFITVLFFIGLYNGERGRNDKFSKYLFYVFYPAHLWIIATINYIIK